MLARRCRHCSRNWPISAFTFDRTPYKCDFCVRAGYREYYNSDKRKQYLSANREKLSARSKKWTEDNPERYKKRLREWQKANPKNYVDNNRRRRARKAKLPATLTSKEWSKILEKFDQTCAYCGASDIPLDQEHVIPVFQGGGYTKDNIVPACRSCNLRKGTKTPEEAEMSLRK